MVEQECNMDPSGCYGSGDDEDDEIGIGVPMHPMGEREREAKSGESPSRPAAAHEYYYAMPRSMLYSTALEACFFLCLVIGLCHPR